MGVPLVVLVAVLVVLSGCGSLDSQGDPQPSTTATNPSSGPDGATSDSKTPTPTPTTGTPPPTTATPPATTATPPATTDTPPPTTITEYGPDATVSFFPVPPGAEATYSPIFQFDVSSPTRNQAFDLPTLDPPAVTDWYRTEMDGWTQRVDVESYNGNWGWMNHLVFTKGDDLLYVYVKTAATATEITLSRGSEAVGLEHPRYYGSLGWEPVTYTTSPVPVETIDQVVGLGNLAPSGHTFPTDHSYVMIPHEERPVPVVAPADGIVTSIWYRPGDDGVDDYAVTIMHSNVHTTQFQHLSSIDPAIVGSVGGLAEGENDASLPVLAGDRLGTAPTTHSTALDWFTSDTTRRNDGFVHPEYYGQAVHLFPFLDYATPELVAAYEPKFTRTEAPRYGKIDYDQPGRLVGNWFLDTDPLHHWYQEGHLAFVYSVHDPDDLRVSVGGTILPPGRYAVTGNSPDPASVTPESGPVVYHLQVAHGSGQVDPGIVATVLVEVLPDNRIRVQGYDGRIEDPEFTEDAKLYVR